MQDAANCTRGNIESFLSCGNGIAINDTHHMKYTEVERDRGKQLIANLNDGAIHILLLLGPEIIDRHCRDVKNVNLFFFSILCRMVKFHYFDTHFLNSSNVHFIIK